MVWLALRVLVLEVPTMQLFERICRRISLVDQQLIAYMGDELSFIGQSLRHRGMQ
jgi:hypothetical protein